MADMTFWFNEAARDSYALDQIYWSRLDSFCISPVRDQAERSDYVCRADIHKGLDTFVNRKMEHLRQYKLELGVGQECEKDNDEDDYNHGSDLGSSRISMFFRVTISVAVMMASTYIIVRRYP
jgi:hypothetical protein